MDEYQIGRRVLTAEVSGGRVLGRPRLGWMDGVKVALSNRGLSVERKIQCAEDTKEWTALVHMYLNEFHAAIFAWPCALLDLPPPCSAMSIFRIVYYRGTKYSRRQNLMTGNTADVCQPVA